MKTILFFISIITTQLSFANLQTASDIALIMQNQEVKDFLGTEEMGYFQAVKFGGRARCLGGPSRYALELVSRTGDSVQTCLKMVTVGECGATGERTKVELYPDMQCEVQ